MADGITTRRSALIGTMLAASQGGAARAQPHEPDNNSRTARANAGTVGFISGGVDGTYIRIAADLAAVLDDGDRLRVLPVVGKGSVQNLADILYLRGIDIGIVQSDALAHVLHENTFPGIGRVVNYIAKLYDEEIHILARAEVSSVADLAGKKVNFDVRGSGTAMTAGLVFNALGVAVQPTYEPPSTALERLRKGEIAALLYVTGKPASLFAAIGAGSGLHFLPLPASAALLETYLPSQLSHASYPALVPEGPAVDTMAVGAVMAVYAWQPGTERHRKVVRFIDALAANFAKLLQPPRHPKWREVNLAAQVPGWTRFDAAAEPAPPPAPPPRPRPRTWGR